MTIKHSSRAATIAQLYARYLGRYPDAAGLNLLLGAELEEAALEDFISKSDECRLLDNAVRKAKIKLAAAPSHKKKLLLLGAYGNGNLGDIEMAHVIAQEIETHHDVLCYAHSPLAVSDYPFAQERKLDASYAPLNPRVLELFDGLVIAGGGFLAWPHDPIWTPSWAYLVPIPYAILAVGVGTPIDLRIHNLVREAYVASSRDPESLAEMRKVKPGAQLCPDPIMSLYKPDLPPKKQNAVFRRIFVVRGGRISWHDKVKAQLRESDDVVFFEEVVDAPLRELFPNAILVQTMKAFVDLVAQADLVISERYHGAILSLLCQCPTIGVYRGDHNSSKIVSLFATLGLERYCSPDPLLPEEISSFPLAEVARGMQSFRDDYRQSAASIIERLLNARAA